MRSPRLRSSRSALLPILLLIAAIAFWPMVDAVQRQTTHAQNVSWLSSDSASYLNGSGIPVWLPSWLPGPVAGTTPEIYAGGGSYSIYFYSGGSFLYISGVAGGGFPGGSEANLNVELTVNASVQGYPAIQDIGIPEGSETPIYDKTMWIAGGVFYTISGNGLDSDSLTLANSSVVLQAPAPAPEPVPTDPPVVEQPPVETGGQNSGTSGSTSGQNTVSETTTESRSDSSSTTSSSNASDSQSTVDESEQTSAEPTATGTADDGTGGPWYTGHDVSDLPSDGTAGAMPPRLAPDDGTGGPP